MNDYGAELIVATLAHRHLVVRPPYANPSTRQAASEEVQSVRALPTLTA